MAAKCESRGPHRMLTASGEAELISRVRAGDKKAADELVLFFLPMIKPIVRQYLKISPHLEGEDLQQAAVIGLINALERFDPSAGSRFATYARWWVLSRVREEIVRNSRCVRRVLPRNGGRSVIEAIGLPDLSISVSPGEPGTVPESALPPNQSVAEDHIIAQQRRETLRKAVDMVVRNDRDRDILRRRIFSDPPDTLNTISADWNISRERVRQIEYSLTKRITSTAKRIALRRE